MLSLLSSLEEGEDDEDEDLCPVMFRCMLISLRMDGFLQASKLAAMCCCCCVVLGFTTKNSNLLELIWGKEVYTLLVQYTVQTVKELDAKFLEDFILKKIYKDHHRRRLAVLPFKDNNHLFVAAKEVEVVLHERSHVLYLLTYGKVGFQPGIAKLHSKEFISELKRLAKVDHCVFLTKEQSRLLVQITEVKEGCFSFVCSSFLSHECFLHSCQDAPVWSWSTQFYDVDEISSSLELERLNEDASFSSVNACKVEGKVPSDVAHSTSKGDASEVPSDVAHSTSKGDALEAPVVDAGTDAGNHDFRAARGAKHRVVIIAPDGEKNLNKVGGHCSPHNISSQQGFGPVDFVQRTGHLHAQSHFNISQYEGYSDYLAVSTRYFQKGYFMGSSSDEAYCQPLETVTTFEKALGKVFCPVFNLFNVCPPDNNARRSSRQKEGFTFGSFSDFLADLKGKLVLSHSLVYCKCPCLDVMFHGKRLGFGNLLGSIVSN